MTYSSSWIETTEPARRGEKDFGQVARKLCDLGHAPGNSHYWLPVVAAWSRANGCGEYWIDSAWLRVEVSAADLARFLHDTFGRSHELTQNVCRDIHDGAHYFIVAEEF